ncbi:hypothetical protein HCA61_18755 [Rhodococcus sp. HNM0563]|uniref:DUF6389 family protein n=1 Tax=Rhodococcus sp. HNM0563 TaxID=2716339 RepID=UPI00146E26B0|nr:hypothetical protein [Rhodococcus sp. HNM0563]
MDTGDYEAAVRRILTTASTEVADRLRGFLAAARADGVDIEGITIDVVVDQDGEGPFDVWARFDGRDAFLLDRRFDEERRLFGVEWGELGWEPAVPSRLRDWTRDDLEAVVVEVVTRWIEPLIPAGSPDGFWSVGAPEGLRVNVPRSEGLPA